MKWTMSGDFLSKNNSVAQGRKSSVNLLPDSGTLYYYPGFYSHEKAGHLFRVLSESISWQQNEIRIFGRTLLQPRLSAWFADEGITYKYSRLSLNGTGWDDVLFAVKTEVEVFTGERFNSALLNLYRNGGDSMGWHRDNENELGQDPQVASLSLGAVREFRLRKYLLKKEQISIAPAHGSLILMLDETQTYWEHSVPKVANAEARLNITFRNIKY